MKNRTPKKENNYGSNICFECALACGGCEWSAVDLNTKKVRFEPVPGWTAKPTVVGKTCAGTNITSFHVTACPKFKLMRRNPHQRHPEAPKRPVVATDAHGGNGVRFESIAEGEKGTGARGTNIIAACKGKIRTAGGYRWRYAEEEPHGTKTD